MKQVRHRLTPGQLYTALFCLGFTVKPISDDGAAHVTGPGVDFVTHALAPLFIPGGRKNPRRHRRK